MVIILVNTYACHLPKWSAHLVYSSFFLFPELNGDLGLCFRLSFVFVLHMKVVCISCVLGNFIKLFVTDSNHLSL